MDPYPLLGGLLSCRGKGFCGTCAVIVDEPDALSAPSKREARYLRKQGDFPGLRLSCQATLAGDVRRLLRQGLSQLAEPLRSVLILREVLGYKYEEMAEALEIPLNTVRVYLHRGRKRMRDHLAEVYVNDA